MTVAVRIRRRVSLAGQARGADGAPVSAERVCLSPRCEAGPAWSRNAALRDDGVFFFLDLPPGDHVVGGCDVRGRLFDVRDVTIEPRRPAGGGSIGTSPAAPADASDARPALHASTAVDPLLGFDLVMLGDEAAIRPTP